MIIPGFAENLTLKALTLMNLLGQTVSNCTAPLQEYPIRAGQWITGLARTIADKGQLEFLTVLNNINAANGWDTAPSKLHPGDIICLEQEYIQLLDQANHIPLCPAGSPDCFTQGLTATTTVTDAIGNIGNINVANPVYNPQIPEWAPIVVIPLAMMLVSGIVYGIRHRSQNR